MSIFSDSFTLDKDKFEELVSVGMSKQQILLIFQVTSLEMDKWCGENYGIPKFQTVYEIVKSMAVSQYLGVVQGLMARGNSTALGIVNEVLRGATNQGVVKIVFGNDLPEEDEEDKKDNGK